MNESVGNMQRVRTACDRCQVSKVRCSRGKPKCWRCSQNGQQCVYSLFRKIGRPPKQIASDSKCYTNVHNNVEEVIRIDQQTIMEGNNLDWSDTSGEAWQQMHVMDIETDLDVASRFHCHPNSQQHIQSPPLLTAHFQNWTDLDQSCYFDPNGSETQLSTENTPGWEQADRIETPPANLSDSSQVPYSPKHSNIDHTRDGNRNAIAYNDPRDYSLSDSSLSSIPTPAENPAGEAARDSLEDQFQFRTTVPTSFNSHPKSSGTRPKLADSNSLDSEVKPRAPFHGQQREYAKCSVGCYAALTKILIRLTEWDAEREEIPLESLLRLDRELQYSLKEAFACCYCRARLGNQGIIMLRIIALDNFLRLFEKQQDQSRGCVTGASPTNLVSPPGSRPPVQGAFPWTTELLLLGKYTVSGNVKATVLRQLVLSFVENLVGALSELESEIDATLRDFSRKIAREMVGEIGSRAGFFKGVLQLASEPSLT